MANRERKSELWRHVSVGLCPCYEYLLLIGICNMQAINHHLCHHFLGEDGLVGGVDGSNRKFSDAIIVSGLSSPHYSLTDRRP